MGDDPKLRVVPAEPEPAGPIAIAKPAAFSLDNFRSKLDTAVTGVETLVSSLPISSISRAGDFVRLHPDEEHFWTPELCFVSVPIKGQKDHLLHLINEDLARRKLVIDKVARFRLALASKPGNAFFLCRVPSQRLDNLWNKTNLQACVQAKTLWTQAVSKKEDGAEGYRVTAALDQDIFPEPKWPTQTLDELIQVTFNGCIITDENHAGLLRLLGAKPAVS
jgi:hypothetical protein